jgi:hypothetical protein
MVEAGNTGRPMVCVFGGGCSTGFWSTIVRKSMIPVDRIGIGRRIGMRFASRIECGVVLKEVKL